MSFRLRRMDSNEGGRAETPPEHAWLRWTAHAASLVFVAGGLFLIYQYWARLHRRMVLVTGILFVLYGVYRIFLVRRSGRRH